MREDLHGKGPVVAGCVNYRRRFRDVAMAERWCEEVALAGNCPEQHEVLDDGK